MVPFISNEVHLMEVMKGLSNPKSRSIQMHIFSVFILFASNPYKSESVYYILQRNKEKIRAFTEKIGRTEADPMCLEFCDNFDKFIDMRQTRE